MNLIWKERWVLLLLATFVQIHCPHLVNSQSVEFPIANLSTTWTNSPSAPNTMNFVGSVATTREILLRGTSAPRFACGFYCNGNCDTYLFAVFIQIYTSIFGSNPPRTNAPPQVIWFANGNFPVQINATLQLTLDGDLVLRDVDGTIAWSTNTAGKSVAGLNMTENGNLVLFDANNATVWQSFDQPSDTLVLGQKLGSGLNLTARVSETNWSPGGLYSISVTSEGLFAFIIKSNPLQAYYKTDKLYFNAKQSNQSSYVQFVNGSLALYINRADVSDPTGSIRVPVASSLQCMRLESDGHLRVYEDDTMSWKQVADLLTGYIGDCGYPMVCGEYGICSNGTCTCPPSTNGTSYFKQINDTQPDLGCSETNSLTCEASRNHSFLPLKNVTYFTFTSDIADTDMESCEQACLKNCSCKAALFRYGPNSSSGSCYLPSQLYSLMENEAPNTYTTYAFVKVQTGPSALAPSSEISPTPVPLEKKTGRVAIIVGSSLGAFFGLFIIIGMLVFLLRKKRDSDEDEEDYLDQVPGMPTRFSYEELKAATEDFCKKLGAGGFGSVFEGTLSNGMKVAVKQLEGLGHIKRSFLAEVETIGSIHHVNLVRLIGFCADKSHRLLVYEYMCNGSLDKWIFHKNNELSLDWQQRRKIILEIAKGLAYLHEECRQKIVHLDIKPQNILLNQTFDAKVSDFGLAKLIDRDQSQVMTTMRGTPGYLAPEWLSSIITEKVDVYSYGVVVLEILCGRKNLDRSQPDEFMHLLSLFKKKAEEEQLLDMVDKDSEDMQLHSAEVVEMMRLAAWCLQGDFTKRPSMSVVVKVLEGVMDVEQDLDYNFSNPPLPRTAAETGHKEVKFSATTPLLPSVLSGPR